MIFMRMIGAVSNTGMGREQIGRELGSKLAKSKTIPYDRHVDRYPAFYEAFSHK